MTDRLYATVNDTIVMVKNKKNVDEERNVEGPIVIQDIAVDGDFAEKYAAIKTLYPTSIVRFMKDARSEVRLPTSNGS